MTYERADGQAHASWCDAVVKLAADPYQEELQGNSTPVWMCDCERADSAADI